MPVIETSLGRLAELDGDRVEFMVRTDVPAYQARLPKMGWQPAGQEEATAGHLELLPWRGRQVPVPSLSAQLAAAERRGLNDRAALIRQAMYSLTARHDLRHEATTARLSTRERPEPCPLCGMRRVVNTAPSE